MFKTEISIEGEKGEPNRISTVFFEDFVYSGHESEAENNAKKYLEYLAHLVEDNDNYIDHGGAGKVYDLGDRNGGCLKIMKNRHLSKNSDMFNLGRTPLQEFQIMERLHGLSRLGCRAPVAEMCIETGDTAIIIMEKLEAVNLQHVFNGTKELPDGFDYELFYKALEDFIDAMHKERGVAHQDLYPRNVMIDLESGLPYVIDFGRSVILDKDNESKWRDHTEDDWAKYDEIFFGLEKIRAIKPAQFEQLPLTSEEYYFDQNIKVHYSSVIIQEVKELLERNPPSEDDQITIKFGKNENLIVSRNKENIHGIFSIVQSGLTYYVGRKKKDYLV